MACKEDNGRQYAKGFCDGAIDALYSSIKNWCVPGNITHGEVQRYLKRELLKKRPQVPLLNADKFVANAISKKWPCSDNTYLN